MLSSPQLAPQVSPGGASANSCGGASVCQHLFKCGACPESDPRAVGEKNGAVPPSVPASGVASPRSGGASKKLARRLPWRLRIQPVSHRGRYASAVWTGRTEPDDSRPYQVVRRDAHLQSSHADRGGPPPRKKRTRRARRRAPRRACRPQPLRNDHDSRRRHDDGPALAGCASAVGAAPTGARSERRKRATAMSPIRALRSFSRHCWISVMICGGTSDGSTAQLGVDFTTEAIVSVTSSPSNARLPASISNNTAPNAHTSVRLSTGRPRACSGDM